MVARPLQVTACSEVRRVAGLEERFDCGRTGVLDSDRTHQTHATERGLVRQTAGRAERGVMRLTCWGAILAVHTNPPPAGSRAVGHKSGKNGDRMTPVKNQCATVGGVTTTQPVNSEWMQSPLVNHAIEQAGDQAEPLDVLETLLRLMLEMEEKCPGVPFTTILAGVKPDPTEEAVAATAVTLEGLGYNRPEICEILGIDTYPGGDDIETIEWPTAVATNGRGGIAEHPGHSRSPKAQQDRFLLFREARRSGLTVKQTADKYGVNRQMVYRYYRLFAPKATSAVG